MRRLVVGAIAGLALTLAPALAASPAAPDPSTLAANLPDPIDPTWVESPVEAAQYLDGPVTYESLRSYYTYYHQSETFIDTVIGVLRDNHFVAGYQRMWYRPNTSDILAEQIDVFANSADASSAMATTKAQEAVQSGVSTTYFDPGLGSTAYGALATLSGINFATVAFTKGDASYLAGMISDRVLAADYVTPQARLLWDHAPATIDFGAPRPAGSTFFSKDWVFIVAGLWVILSVAVVAVVLVIFMFARRRTAPPPPAQLSMAEPPPI